VYLTDIYGPYFAMCATTASKCAIVEVDMDRLVPQRLAPDEDFLEQATRKQDGDCYGDMQERTLHYKALTIRNRHLAMDSLKHLGTIGHIGTVPKRAITRIALFNTHRPVHPAVIMTGEPSVTIQNHKFCHKKYQNLTRWFFQDEELNLNIGIPQDLAETMGITAYKIPERPKGFSVMTIKHKTRRTKK